MQPIKPFTITIIIAVIFFLFLGLIIYNGVIWIRDRRALAKLQINARDDKWLQEKFAKANECFKDMDPDDTGYRGVVDDANGTIVFTSVKGAQITMGPTGMYYKAPDSEAWESVVDLYFAKQEERNGRRK